MADEKADSLKILRLCRTDARLIEQRLSVAVGSTDGLPYSVTAALQTASVLKNELDRSIAQMPMEPPVAPSKKRNP